jgi:hypothetical protein
MRIFVTGASGRIGSAVVPELLTAGHRVPGLARCDAAAGRVAAMGAEVRRGDLDDTGGGRPARASRPRTSGGDTRTSEARPAAAIVIVSRDATALGALSRELSGRYSADYRIVVRGEPAELNARSGTCCVRAAR